MLHLACQSGNNDTKDVLVFLTQACHHSLACALLSPCCFFHFFLASIECLCQFLFCAPRLSTNECFLWQPSEQQKLSRFTAWLSYRSTSFPQTQQLTNTFGLLMAMFRQAVLQTTCLRSLLPICFSQTLHVLCSKSLAFRLFSSCLSPQQSRQSPFALFGNCLCPYPTNPQSQVL